VVDRSRARAGSTRTDLADRWLTHPIVGTLVFLGIMMAVFQSIYAWAGPLMDAVSGAFGALGAAVAGSLPEGALTSLLVDGVIAGAGGVLVFLPQILVLFLFLALLEDCGYMARAAMLAHRFMSPLGLSGRSFIPLLSSFACAIPGIMATRTIEHPRDRLVTMLIAPLMSCSARLPVYTLLIGAFIPAIPLIGGTLNLQAVVLLSMYLLGVVVAVVVAMILRRTLGGGPSPPLLIELPSYKWPSIRTIVYRMYEQGRAFVLQAGTIILAVTMIIWALGYYPRPDAIADQHEARREAIRANPPAAAIAAAAPADSEAEHADPLAAALDVVDREEAGAYLRQSWLGRMGEWVEPAVRPLGWDWRIGTAVIASFPAREVVIATMGTIYNLGGDQDEESADLKSTLMAAEWPDGRKVFTLPVALSIMVFFALCCQCGGTLAVMKRETNSWRWPLFTFAYMTGLAYVAAWATYAIASAWG
jgi:ferrous iron transport protein B